MNFENQYNVRSPAVKRLMREASEMHEPTEDYSAAPIGDNLFEWHFTIRGAADSDFEGGIYHGRILFPSEYPMKPPNIVLLTPNGRFETNKKICLSISGHHPETWQPSWCVRTALLALITFMPTSGSGTVGSLDYPADERRLLAKKSREWKCSECGKICDLLANVEPKSSGEKLGNASNEKILENKPKDEIVSTNEFEDTIEVNETDGTISDEYSSCHNETSQCTNANQSEVNENNQVINTELFISDVVCLIASNLSNSKITISILVILIAVLLYRRVFLL